MVSRHRSCGVWFNRIKAPDEFRILDITASRRKVQWHSGPKMRPPHHHLLLYKIRFTGQWKRGGPTRKRDPNRGTAGEPFREWFDQHVRSCQSVEESCPGIFWEGQEIRLTTTLTGIINYKDISWLRFEITNNKL